jgi:hypothetical protein
MGANRGRAMLDAASAPGLAVVPEFWIVFWEPNLREWQRRHILQYILECYD